jgi:hypothetical protein
VYEESTIMSTDMKNTQALAAGAGGAPSGAGTPSATASAQSIIEKMNGRKKTLQKSAAFF